MEQYTRFFLALAFTLFLIWALAWLAKRFGWDKKMRGIGAAQGRLSIGDVLYLDPKRKVTLVRADDREYLILLSGDRAEVIDKWDKK